MGLGTGDLGLALSEDEGFGIWDLELGTDH